MHKYKCNDIYFFPFLHTLLGNWWNPFRALSMLSQWKSYKTFSFPMCPRATSCLRATGWAGQETRLRVGRSGVRITVGTRYICILQNIQTAYGANPDSYSMCTGVISRRVKWLRRDFKHPLQSTTEIKNGWSYTSASPHDVIAYTW